MKTLHFDKEKKAGRFVPVPSSKVPSDSRLDLANDFQMRKFRGVLNGKTLNETDMAKGMFPHIKTDRASNFRKKTGS